MGDHNLIDPIADKYRREGFDVVIHPTPSEVPSFLANTPIDLLARKGGRIVAFKANDEATAEDEQLELAAEFGSDSAILLIEEAERLLNPLTIRSALVMAWSAFEAAARAALQPGTTAFQGSPPRKLLEELLAKGLIAYEEFNILQQSLFNRNVIAHGGRPEELPPELASSVLAVAKRLLKSVGVTSTMRLWDSVGITMVRKGINQSKYKDLVDRATKVLTDLLGSMRNGVAIDWGVAEDSRGHPILVLKLSDATGAVSATFDPSDLEDQNLLIGRLNRLWGDLLEIRSHSQLKHLLGTSGTNSPFGPAA
jgi:REase_AHJR-like